MATQSTADLVPYSLKELMSRSLDLIEKNLPEHNDNEVAKHFRVFCKLADSLKNGHLDDPDEYICEMDELKEATIGLSKWLAENGHDRFELQPEYKTADQLKVLVLHEFYEHYFEESRRISKGSWGHIYEVKNRWGRSSSAVQRMVEDVANLQDLNKAKKEVLALAALFHPNVVKYHYAWIQLAKVSQERAASAFRKGASVKAIFHIQMDMCWKNLPAWLADRNKSLDECQKPDEQTIQDGLKIFQQVMEGLKYVHKNGIAHHDIQPHSILIGFDLVPKIGDFRFPSLRFQRQSQDSEVAKLWSPGGSTPGVASTEECVTTAMKEDIYDMGRILIELICPFPSLAKLREELKTIASGQMRVMKAYPENVRKLIFAMRNDDPSKRPTAQEVLGYPLF